MNRNLLLMVVAGVSVFAPVACTPALDKIPYNEFAPQKMEKWNEPFTGVWVGDKLKNKEHNSKTIYIAPIDLRYLQSENNSEEDKQEQAKLASYFDSELKKDLAKYGVSVISSPKDADLELQLALVKISRTKAYLSYASLGTSFFIPYVGSVISALAHGDMALAGRFIDPKTKRVEAAFVDYREDEPSVLGAVRDYTYYGHHRKTVDMWTDKLAELIAVRQQKKIKAPIWFTINPF